MGDDAIDSTLGLYISDTAMMKRTLPEAPAPALLLPSRVVAVSQVGVPIRQTTGNEPCRQLHL